MSGQRKPPEISEEEMERRRRRHAELLQNEAAYVSLRIKLCEVLKLPIDSTTDGQIIWLVTTAAEWLRVMPRLRKDLGIQMHKGISVIASIDAMIMRMKLIDRTMALAPDHDQDATEAMASYRAMRARLGLPDGARVIHLLHAVQVMMGARESAAAALEAQGRSIEGVDPLRVIEALCGELAILREELAVARAERAP